MKTTALLNQSDQKFLDKYNKTTKSLDLWTTEFELWVLYDSYIVVVLLPEDWEGGILAPQNALVSPRVVDCKPQYWREHHSRPQKVISVKLPKPPDAPPKTKAVDNPLWDEFKVRAPYKNFLLKQDIEITHCLDTTYITQPKTNVTVITAEYVLELVVDRTLPDYIELYDMVRAPEGGIQALLQLFEDYEGQDLISDLETFGYDTHNLHGLHQFEGKVRLLQIKPKGVNRVLVFDFGERDNRISDANWQVFTAYYRRHALNHTWVYHSAPFDLRWAHYHFGVDTTAGSYRCTMNTSKVVWSGISSMRHDLGSVAKREGVPCHDKSLQKADWGGKLYPPHYRYAGGDVVVTDLVDEAQLYPTNPHDNRDAVLQMNRLIPVVQSLNMSGYPINDESLQRTYDTALRTQESLLAKLGMEWNIWEPTKNAEVQAVLEQESGNQLSDVGMGTLKEIGSPLAWTLMNYRCLTTRLNYLGNMLKSRVKDIPNRAFTLYSLTNPQASGRMAAGQYFKLSEKQIREGAEPFGFNGLNPSKDSRDFTNIPSIRAEFKTDDDHVWGSCDLSGCHLRAALVLSGQDDVLDQICNSDDGHADTSVYIAQEVGLMFTPYQDLDSYFAARAAKDPIVGLLRELAKTGIYSIINFCTGASLQATLAEKEIFLSLDICNSIVAAIWKRVPKVKTYVQNITREAAKGIVYTSSGCRRPSNNYGDYRTLYTKDMEISHKQACKVHGYKSEKAKKLADRPVGYCLVTAITGRHRYFPVYERVSYKGSSPSVYRSVSNAAVASHLWASCESKVMGDALIRFQREYILPKRLPMRDLAITCWPYDEAGWIAPKSLGLESAQAISALMEEEWTRLFPGVPGVTTAPEKMIAQSWADVH